MGRTAIRWPASISVAASSAGALSDQDLSQIIRNGIPGTPMPASNFSEEQAARVVAYLRSVAASRQSVSAAGDAVRGKSAL